MKFTAVIHVRPKGEIRDPQGEAISSALQSLGFKVAGVRAGKELIVSFEADDADAAQKAAQKMGAELLANPVIEDFAVELKSA